MTNKYMQFAIETAREAGDLVMSHYGKLQKLEWKLITNFKTQVDDESDKLIRRRINESFPKHNIFSEEQDELNRNSEYSWVIDPIDGTIPYSRQISDYFSVCIALVKEKEPVIGVIYAPKREELYYASKDRGAFCNNSRIYVNEDENINHAVIGLDGGKETKGFKRASLMKYEEKLLTPNGICCNISSGCASVPLCLVASGKINAYLALSLEPWDMAAAVIINREAGGRVTNIQGKQWELGDYSILTANPKLHNKFYNLIK